METIKFSPHFDDYKQFIVIIYALAVVDLVFTYFFVTNGGIELNPFGAALIATPVLLALWKFGGVTILLAIPYFLSEQLASARYVWLGLVGVSLFPVVFQVYYFFQYLF